MTILRYILCKKCTELLTKDDNLFMNIYFESFKLRYLELRKLVWGRFRYTSFTDGPKNAFVGII